MYDAQCGSTVDPESRRNIAECAICHTIIESKHRHDLVRCKCGAIALDGGSEYKRRLGEPSNFIPVTTNTPEQIKDLSTETLLESSLNELIAIYDGWTKEESKFGRAGFNIWTNPETLECKLHCPDYCNDINLLRKVINKLNPDEHCQIEAQLFFKIGIAPNPMLNAFLAPGHVIAECIIWVLNKKTTTKK